jgi:hypothetical protein
MRCVLCADPVDLSIDLCADENGEPVHEICYVNRLTRARFIQSSVERLLDTLSAQPVALYCVKCNTPLLYVGATFFLENGNSRTIPLPVCKNCNRQQHPTMYTGAA